MRLVRTTVLAGVGALAATPSACRRHEPVGVDCLRLDGPEQPVGFGATFSVKAAIACPSLAGGRVVWRQSEGVPLASMSTGADGFALTARTAPLAESAPGRVPWGVVPLSPRTRGDVVLVASWTDGRGASLAREIRVAAAQRSRGLPNTPVGVRVYLGGEGWQITARPANSHAALDLTAGATSLLPDVSGDWRLADSAGRALALRAGRYDETPLDCGRAGCHPAITDAVAASPMTTVFARLMDVRPAGYPGCALACHTTGEPGAPDGGFAHVASELGPGSHLTGRWEDLPRDLHRLGGVGCLACHGPGAIPEASARWGILRADVCAVCHDAPPRYGHVVAWRETAMARADRDPRARSERACARCHTTAGFLAAVAAPERGPVDRRAPVDAGPVGISCSGCHAVHDPRRTQAAPRLLRGTPVPGVLAGATESVCLPCHAPDLTDGRPAASAAAIWLGRGGLDPETGAPLTGGAPHAAVARGCVGCHGGGPDSVERGAGHAFRARTSACAPCHRAALPAAPDVRARAQQLWRALETGDSQRPAHADGAERGPRIDRGTRRGRALWDLLLVLEDRGAAAHNARYAGALLDAAASVLETGDGRRAPR
jgi:hypothetical protein